MTSAWNIPMNQQANIAKKLSKRTQMYKIYANLVPIEDDDDPVVIETV